MPFDLGQRGRRALRHRWRADGIQRGEGGLGADAQVLGGAVKSWYEVTQDAEGCWPRHESVAQAAAFIEFSDQEWTRSGCGPYLIWSRIDTTLLGGTGLHVHEPGRAETGYVLAKDAWGAKSDATKRVSATLHAEPFAGLTARAFRR
jgi:RimJ/RimL family protein N-acetyltransferase